MASTNDHHDSPALPVEQPEAEPLFADQGVPVRAGPEAGTSPPAEAPYNFPKSLSEPITQIERVIEEGGDPSEGIRHLCQRALTKPDSLVEAASIFLAHILADENFHLCAEIPPAFVAEELVNDDNAIIAPAVLAHLKSTGDQPRLVRLASALIDREAFLASPSAGRFLFDVAAEVAVQKPLMSSQLIDIACRLIGPGEECPVRDEAMRMQAAGEFLREEGATFRTFWHRRLRNPDAAPDDWTGREALEAVACLVRAEAAGRELPSIFEDAIPPDVWSHACAPAPPAAPDAVVEEATREEEPENDEPEIVAPVKPPRPVQAARPDTKLVTKSETAAKRPAAEKSARKTEPAIASQAAGKRSSFSPVFLMGGLGILVAGMWLGRETILKSFNPQPALAAVPSASSPAPTSPVVATKPPPSGAASPAVPLPDPPLLSVARPPAKPATQPVVAPAAAPSPPAAPADAPPSAAPAPLAPATAPVSSPPRQMAAASPPPAASESAPPASPEAVWRKVQFDEIVKQHPAIVRWHGMTKTASWRDAHSMLMGQRSFLPWDGDEFAGLLKLLLLDPPQDPAVREAVPKIAARRLPTREFIALWEKLVYPGSPNEKEIRAAADAYLSVKSDYLALETVERLKKLAAPAAAAPAR